MSMGSHEWISIVKYSIGILNSDFFSPNIVIFTRLNSIESQRTNSIRFVFALFDVNNNALNSLPPRLFLHSFFFRSWRRCYGNNSTYQQQIICERKKFDQSYAETELQRTKRINYQHKSSKNKSSSIWSCFVYIWKNLWIEKFAAHALSHTFAPTPGSQSNRMCKSSVKIS